MCGTHTRSHAVRVQRSGQRPAGTCEIYLAGGHRWCGHQTLPGDRVCEFHAIPRNLAEMAQLHTLEEQQDIVDSVMSGDWDAEDDDDLIDSITDETGWCINAITFVNLTN